MALTTKLQKHVTLTGVAPLMFDRYAGDNKTQLTPEQKLYLQGDTVCLPALNLMSFLTAVNTESAPRMIYGKQAKTIGSALLATTQILPSPLIPLLRKGKPIRFGGTFEGESFVDPVSGITVVQHVARLPKGIPNPKQRPVLDLPWSLEFDLTVYPHDELSSEIVQNLFDEGGARLGLGTFRKMFGKFTMAWE